MIVLSYGVCSMKKYPPVSGKTGNNPIGKKGLALEWGGGTRGVFFH